MLMPRQTDLRNSNTGTPSRQALCFATNEDEYASIGSATHTVMFFGTPHFGADKRKWLSIAEAFTTLAEDKVDYATGKRRPAKLVEMITRNAHDLAEISEDFCHVAPRYKIKTFYEALPFRKTDKTIVDKMDAHMFLHNEVSMLVHADHLGMVQFEDDQHETFLQVCQYVSEAVKDEGEKAAPAPPQLPQGLWLAKEQMAKDIVKMLEALDQDREVHINPGAPRRAVHPTAATPAGGRKLAATGPLLLANVPARRKMPWEEDIEEKRADLPVVSAVRVTEFEDDVQEEIGSLRSEIGPQWATDACVSDSEVEDGSDDEEVGTERPTDAASRQPETRINPYQKKATIPTVNVAAVDELKTPAEASDRQAQILPYIANKKGSIPTTTTKAAAMEEQETSRQAAEGKSPPDSTGKVYKLVSRMWRRKT
ncbi:hypothetical protein DL767_006914 [Monosporascus sp. MG133]|nr:hypothetical protein DL767_006914 [Monosporascus sp. MG133]